MGSRHIDGLDGLRGAAVLAVLLFHAGHLTGGWLGVDLFFVLSGFLITSLLLDEHREHGRIALSSFWARRARRLLPALGLVLFGVGVYAAVWAEPRELGSIRGDALATFGYVANWHQIASGDLYWDLFKVPSPLQHTWSLAIEEQFYLLWPLVVVAVLARRRSATAVMWVSLVGVVASFGAMLLAYSPGGNPQRAYLGTDTRASSLLLGAALAAFVSSRRVPRFSVWARVALEASAVASIAFVLWAWLSLSGGDPDVYGGLLLATAVAGALVIAAVAHPLPGPVARLVSVAPLRSLGVISYGVYLWHWPIYLTVNEERTGLDGWLLTALRLGVTLAFAAASYRLVELPIRRQTFRGRKLTLASVGALTIVVMVVSVSTIARPAPTVTAQQRASIASEPVSADATLAPPTIRVVVVGDSLGATIIPALRFAAPAARFEVIDRTFSACSLHSGATGKRSDADYEYVLHVPAGTELPVSKECSVGWRDIPTRDQPDVVLIVLAGSTIGEWLVDGQWTGACDNLFDDWYTRLLADEISAFQAGGADVVLTLPIASFFAQRQTGCIRSSHQRAALAVGDVSTVDLRDFACPSGECLDEIDGIRLREDGFHFTGAGADLLVAWLAPRIREAASSGS